MGDGARVEDGKLVVEFDLAGLLLYQQPDNAIHLRDAIVEAAGKQALDHTRDAVERRLTERAQTIADDELRVLLRPVLEKAVNAAVQPSNRYGEPKGEPVTLSERIVQIAQKALEKTPADSRYGRVTNTRGGTVLDQIIEDEVGKAVRSRLQEAMRQAEEQVRDAVRAEGAKVLQETIARMAR